MRGLLKSLRPLHWSKNLLVFAPVLLAHETSSDALLAVLLAFTAFCLLASGTYLLNDVRDREHDRSHPKKRFREIASGGVAPLTALIAGVLLIASGVAIAASVSLELLWYLAGYALLSLTYSFVLKRRVFLDVLALSALWTIRVLAGGVAAGVEVSDWLLALSVFLFVGLALLKRYADLGLHTAEVNVVPGRGYMPGDRDLVRSMGVASSYLAVLVLALYLSSPKVAELYGSPRLLWLICPLLLYWIAHMWFLAHRGEIQDDPIVVATRDPASYVVGILIMVIAWLAVQP
ncbi:MAG TPA: UbiA family prenyltransferase [Thermoanaerobaculia bacterium]